MGAASLSVHLASTFGVYPATEALTIALLGLIRLAAGKSRAGDLDRALLVQTAAAAAAASSFALVVIAGLLPPAEATRTRDAILLIGTLIGALGVVALRACFGTRLLPAAAPWPPGQLVASALTALPGLHGAAFGLLGGLGSGLLASARAPTPAVAAFGLAFVGNPHGLAMLAIGLLGQPAINLLVGSDARALSVSRALLVGGGLAAIAQAAWACARPGHDQLDTGATSGPALPARASPLRGRSRRRRSSGAARPWLIGLATAFALQAALASVAFLTAGTDSAASALAGIVQALALGSLSAALILLAWVGLTLIGSRAGWSPVFGAGLLVLSVGALLGLRPSQRLILVGLALVGAPLVVEVCYQLKAGELLGQAALRGQQALAALIGLAAALGVVSAGVGAYLEQGLIPPIATVLSSLAELASLEAVSPWVIPWVVGGALLQIVGGPERQAGLLLATGLLVASPVAGWAILAGLLLRMAVVTLARRRMDLGLAAFGLGCVGGEVIRSAIRVG